ncbi:MAG: flippase-like domain-containing protein [Chloroflexi bacterium]|nr:flippase-like domain-containing protein [Chloroflexota bacterium]
MAGETANTEPMKRNAIIYIVSGILTIALLAYVLANLDWSILKTAFANLRWGWLIFALTAYLVNIGLRALRFSNLIYTRRIHWLELVPVSSLHNILMYLLPAKTGDATYIFIAKERLNLPIPEGTATLFAARFYDFSVVALILAMILPFAKDEMPDWIFNASLIFCILVLVGALTLLAVLRFTKSVEPMQSKNRKTIFARIKQAWRKFMEGLREIQAHGAHPRIIWLTAGIWLCLYLNFYSAAQCLSLPISFYHVVIISIVMIPLTLLPLQGFANIGAHEIGWTSALVAFQYSYETALAIAAGSHFVLLISVIISGALAFFGSQAIFILAKGKHETVP